MTTMTVAAALNAALRRSMEKDPTVVLLGEDIGRLGGVFRVTDGLQKDFGEARVIDFHLAESALVGTAIGLAMRGFRPVVEIQFDGFVYPAFDQIVTQLAKLHRRSDGAVSLPVVVRIPFGGGIGAVEHHSESPEAYFAHTAGLRVLAAADAATAYLTLQQAIACDDPVIYLEPKRRYWDRTDVDPTVDVARAPSPWQARVVRPGTDLTLACYGPMVRTCLEAADAHETASIEVVDLQSLSPLDVGTLAASVRRTGRLVVVHEAQLTGGLGAEVAARVTETCFFDLEAPVLRVTGYDVPYPPARLEAHHLPDVDRVLDGVDRALAY